VTLGNALDHLLAWAGVFIRGQLQPVYAHYTLVRSAIESTATARWLVDPKVDPRVRVARGIGYTITDLVERKRIEQIPWPESAPPRPARSATWRPAVERIANLEERAAVAGLCPLKISHTDVVARFGPGEFVYRVLSAFAHGGLAIPFAASEGGEPSEPDAGGLYTVRTTSKYKLTIDLTDAAVTWARAALVEVFAYHGHDATPPTAAA
jgi:hypothetical protein